MSNTSELLIKDTFNRATTAAATAVNSTTPLDIAKKLASQHGKGWIIWNELKQQSLEQSPQLTELQAVMQIRRLRDIEQLFCVECSATCFVMCSLHRNISEFEHRQKNLQTALLNTSEIDSLAVFSEEQKQMKMLEKVTQKREVQK